MSWEYPEHWTDEDKAKFWCCDARSKEIKRQCDLHPSILRVAILEEENKRLRQEAIA